MSDCMIIRRGGGGQGFDPNGAVLKVITSTGCTVAVTNVTAGYSKTHQQADGYPRSNNADVTEHFFSIPASAFGTLTVTVSKVYTNEGVSDTLTASKTIDVSTVGKVYEVLIAAPNIILNSTFGLQNGLTLGSGVSYSDRDKELTFSTTSSSKRLFLTDIPIMPYSTVTVTARAYSSYDTGYFHVVDQNVQTLCTIAFNDFNYVQKSGSIAGQYYPTAYFSYLRELVGIKEIVLT